MVLKKLIRIVVKLNLKIIGSTLFLDRAGCFRIIIAGWSSLPSGKKLIAFFSPEGSELVWRARES
jgi:hypothetical protein